MRACCLAREQLPHQAACSVSQRPASALHQWLLVCVPCQGAHIGEGCLIHTLDVTDFPLLHIGEGVAANDGATIMAHSIKQGYVHFSEAKAPLPPPFRQQHCRAPGSISVL